MKILIAKLGATGDVVRTTTLLRRLRGDITWITAAKNAVLLQDIPFDLRCLTWEEREEARDRDYDLVINLEDTADVAEFLATVASRSTFGAYLDQNKSLRYTDSARRWFDLSLISVHGREKADELKYRNRHTYQELLFDGLGFQFSGEQYVLPTPPATDLAGDVAIAAEAGPVWPMKKWAYYADLAERLRADGLTVNVLPKRDTMLEHLGDVRGHRCLVGGDSLPMHFALGMGVHNVAIFNCTSPWEIWGYGIQTKLVSPLLGEFFYKRTYEDRATRAISLDDVYAAVRLHLKKTADVASAKA